MKRTDRKDRPMTIGRLLVYAGLAVVGGAAFLLTWRFAGGAAPKAAQRKGTASPQRRLTATPTPAGKQTAQPALEYALTLVNAQHPMRGEPEDLVNIQAYLGQPVFPLKSDQMRACAAAVTALQQMAQAASDNGAGDFLVQSAYRGEEYQRTLFDAQVCQCRQEGLAPAQAEEKAALTVARPGESEHETGLAFDIIAAGNADLWDFEGTPQQKWLKEHCWDYGFIVRYPPDKEALTGISSEPWHFRYVGVTHARAMREQDLCLEEYLDAPAPQATLDTAGQNR